MGVGGGEGGGEEVLGEDIKKVNIESRECQAELDKVRKQLEFETVINKS